MNRSLQATHRNFGPARMVPRSAALLIIISALLVASQARAAVLFAYFSGTIHSGESNAFGSLQDVTGYQYTTIYRYDTSKGTRTDHAPIFDDLIGGDYYNTSNPVTATFTIESPSGIDRTLNLNGTFSSEAFISAIAQYVHYDAGVFGSSSIYNEAHVTMPSNADLLTHIANQSADITGYVSAGGPGSNFYINADLSGLGFVSVVPESAAWTLMVIGLGAVGATLRSRRHRRYAVTI